MSKYFIEKNYAKNMAKINIKNLLYLKSKWFK